MGKALWSKVKEVIKEAGLRSDGELVQAASDKVHEILGAAARRAMSNRRTSLMFHDIDCWSDAASRPMLLRPGLLRRMLARHGLRGDPEFIRALSDTVHGLLADAIFRATANRRSTVRPYDL